MLHTPFYNPAKTYEENFEKGPFGAFSHTKSIVQKFKPTYKFLGFSVNSLFGIPAGPLLNSNYVQAAFNMGFDIICYKTQRSVPFTVNAFPNVLIVETFGKLTIEKTNKPLLGKLINPTKEDFSITNSFGNPSRGPAFWEDDLKKAISYANQGQLLIMSVVGTIKEGFTKEDYYDDFATASEIAKKAGAEAIEVNLSCPNVANEGILCFTPGAVESICRKVKEKIGNIPLIAKIGFFSNEQQELLETVVDKMAPFVQAISAINTIPAPIVDEKGEQALPGPNRLYSGVCGAGIKWAGLDNVTRLVKIREERGYTYEIIGVGGVMKPNDYLDYKKAGADVVMSATGAMWNPFLAQEIKKKTNE